MRDSCDNSTRRLIYYTWKQTTHAGSLLSLVSGAICSFAAPEVLTRTQRALVSSNRLSYLPVNKTGTEGVPYVPKPVLRK